MKKESIMNRKHFYIIAGIFILALAGCSIKKEDTKKIQDILNIIKYTYNIEINDNSLNYERFVTHLRFFFKRLKDIEFTVVAPEDVPEELKEDIEKARDTPFRLTYADQGYLYMARGYGEKEKTGYSVEVNACYETSDAIRIQTTLLGPAKGEKTKEKKTYPYVVMKTEYREKDVIFE